MTSTVAQDLQTAIEAADRLYSLVGDDVARCHRVQMTLLYTQVKSLTDQLTELVHLTKLYIDDGNHPDTTPLNIVR